MKAIHTWVQPLNSISWSLSDSADSISWCHLFSKLVWRDWPEGNVGNPPLGNSKAYLCHLWASVARAAVPGRSAGSSNTGRGEGSLWCLGAIPNSAVGGRYDLKQSLAILAVAASRRPTGPLLWCLIASNSTMGSGSMVGTAVSRWTVVAVSWTPIQTLCSSRSTDSIVSTQSTSSSSGTWRFQE